jgi:lipopolysaccharide export system permease protein
LLKNLNLNFIYPYYLTLLNTPITLFEIFPFIFFLSTQFLFYDLFKKDELNLMKINGLNNLDLIKILLIIAISIGILILFFFITLPQTLNFIILILKMAYHQITNI